MRANIMRVIDIPLNVYSSCDRAVGAVIADQVRGIAAQHSTALATDVGVGDSLAVSCVRSVSAAKLDAGAGILRHLYSLTTPTPMSRSRSISTTRL